MWIAKSKLTDQTFGRKYSNIYDCQKYIDNELKELQDIHIKIYYTLEYLKKYKHYSKYSDFVINLFNALSSNIILCYNVEQKRYCTAFDF